MQDVRYLRVLVRVVRYTPQYVYVTGGKDTALYLMGASEPKLRNSGAELLALWEAIKFASRIVERFDLEGSMFPKWSAHFAALVPRQHPYFVIKKAASPVYAYISMLRMKFRFRKFLMTRQRYIVS